MRAHEHGDLADRDPAPAMVLRPFQPARQTQFFAAVRRGRFPLVGDGTQQRSMVFTGNLVLGLLRAEMAAAAPGHAYWIADAEPYELPQILRDGSGALAAEGLTYRAARLGSRHASV